MELFDAAIDKTFTTNGLDALVTFHIAVGRDGQVHSDIRTHNNSYADVSKGLVAVKAEIERVFAEAKNCPHFPRNAAESRKPIVRAPAGRRFKGNAATAVPEDNSKG